MKRLLLFGCGGVLSAILLWPAQDPAPGNTSPNNPRNPQCGDCKKKNSKGKQAQRSRGHHGDGHHHGHHHGHE